MESFVLQKEKLKDLRVRVEYFLENQFKIDINRIEKILNIYFSPNYLHAWYYFSNVE